MIMNRPSISFKNNKLIISIDSDKKLVEFKYEIKIIQKFDDCIIVMIEPPMKVIFNENVFGVSYDGKILWQIEAVKHVHKDSPYTWIGHKNDLLEIYNWDGSLYLVNPKTGKVLNEKFIK